MMGAPSNPRGAMNDLLKTPFAKFFRTRLPLLAVLCGLASIPTSAYMATYVFFYSCPSALRAIAWHHRHGDTVAYDGHLFHVPAFWYPDLEKRPDRLMLHEAHFGSLNLENVIFRTMPQKTDDRIAQQQIAEKASYFNNHSNSPNKWTLEKLQGKRLVFDCMMVSTAGVAELIACQAADSDLEVVLDANGSHRTEALDILETSE
jgi:hypothetical protein